MSVYSQNSSIQLNGTEFDFEGALEKVIAELQGCLNDVQYNLRCVLMMSENGSLFSEECQKSALIEDSLLDMSKLFTDLLDINSQIISIPIEKEDKDYFKKFKAERKQIKKDRLKQIELDKKEEIKERKKNSMSDITE